MFDLPFVILIIHSPLVHPYNLVVPAVLWFTVRVAIILDAVIIARRSGGDYQPKAFNRWYVYLSIVAFMLFVNNLANHVVKRYYVQAFKMAAGSMAPTILMGEHVLVDKAAYKTGTTPQRGDIIVLMYPEDERKDFLKRVIGMPGDTLEIHEKQVMIDGKKLDDRGYTQRLDPTMFDRATNPRDNYGPVTVPKGTYFVMGDNRDQSLDSRFWGYVELSKIKGKVSLIYWSWDREHARVRWERIGMLVN